MGAADVSVTTVVVESSPPRSGDRPDSDDATEDGSCERGRRPDRRDDERHDPTRYSPVAVNRGLARR